MYERLTKANQKMEYYSFTGIRYRQPSSHFFLQKIIARPNEYVVKFSAHNHFFFHFLNYDDIFFFKMPKKKLWVVELKPN